MIKMCNIVEKTTIFILATTLLLTAETTTLAQRFLSSWPIAFLGRISYMMYLYHMFHYQSIGPLLVYLLKPVLLLLPSTMVTYGAMIVLYLSLFIISMILTRLVDDNVISFCRSWDKFILPNGEFTIDKLPFEKFWRQSWSYVYFAYRRISKKMYTKINLPVQESEQLLAMEER